MTPHEARLVNIAVDAHDAPLAGVLPHGDVALVGQHWLVLRIHGNHQLVVVKTTLQVLVVEVAEGVDQRLLTIGMLHQLQERHQRVAELLRRQTAVALDVDHRDEVLLAGQTLGLEVLQLAAQRRLGTEEVVGAHLQTIAVGQVDVAFKIGVDAVATLGSLQVDVGHLRILANRLPEHLALIVRQVDAVDVRTGVLALQIGVVVGLSLYRKVENKGRQKPSGIYFFMLFPIFRLQRYCKLSKKA